jgi:prepilin peptidase CpaA
MIAFPPAQFSAGAANVVGGVLFVLALVLASLIDVRSRRIPNELAAALAFGGLIYSAVTVPPVIGLSRTFASFGIGFGLWIPFYALRMLGAGDVKLFAAASCWLAPSQVFAAALLSALAGGALSVVGLVLAHGFGLTSFRIAHSLRNPRLLTTPLPVPPGRRTLPYGLAMAVGLIVAAWFPGVFGLIGS